MSPTAAEKVGLKGLTSKIDPEEAILRTYGLVGHEVDDERAALYESFKNLEAAKAGLADGVGGLTYQDALVLEAKGQGRQTYIDAFSQAIASEREPEPQPQPKAPESPSPQQMASQDASNLVSRDEVIARLRKADRSYMLQRERVKNPALPIRPDEVRDWPTEFAYFWVPCPPKTRPFHPLEQQNMDGFLRDGWNFYPADLMRSEPNAQNLPWHPGFEADGSKVRWSDLWLLYRSAEYEKKQLESARKRYNDRRDARKHGHGTSKDARGRDYEHVQTGVEGQSTVDRVLRERNDDDQDREFLPR